MDYDGTLEELAGAMEYLHRERRGRMDSRNLMLAAIRGAGDVQQEHAIMLGFESLGKNPDPRMVRTLITYLNRENRPSESFRLLGYMPKSHWRQEMERILQIRMNGPPPSRQGDVGHAPWLYELESDIQAGERLVFVQHRIPPPKANEKEEARLNLQFWGKVIHPEGLSDSSALASFLFFDDQGQEVRTEKPIGLTHSQSVGWYSYLRQNSETGAFTIEFSPPSGTTHLVIGIRRWNHDGFVEINKEMGVKRSSLKELINELSIFENHVRTSGAEHVVFMFSGTTFVQDIRANRPIRLTRDLNQRGIPVIFNYHRWGSGEARPEYEDGLLQIPIDLTTRLYSEIADLEVPDHVKKIFVVSYPHPSIPKVLLRFKTKGWTLIYDVRDEWEEFSKVGAASWYRESVERYITSSVDAVTAVSWPLAEKMNRYEPLSPTVVVPNALSPRFLQPDYEHAPAESPIVGYFGHLTSSWFNWDALFEVAELLPNIQFEIIGHSEPEGLTFPNNVSLLGPRSHPEINSIAARWHVGIIPFTVSVLSDAVDPIKIYEYFALGLPVVSFRMPQIEDYPSTTTVETVEGFAKALIDHIENPPDPDELTAWLEANRWSDRNDQFLDLANNEHHPLVASFGGGA